VVTSGSNAHSESSGADVANGGAGSATCGIQTMPDAVTTTQATTYEASLWARSDTPGGNLKLRLRELDGSLVVGTKVRTLPLSTTWQQVIVRDTPVEPGVSSLNLRAYVLDAAQGACFSVDDASIRST
jgi:hypothetical protein